MKLFGGFYPLFVLEVLFWARVEAQTTTTNPASSGSTCSGATVGCLTAVTGTNTDGCGVVSSRVGCFSGTRTSNCSVDESMVTFDNFLPVFSDICNAVVNYSSSCLEFTFCLLDTDYSVMASAVNYTVGPSVPQIANFTSTRFWCTYTQQTIDCFLRNNVTCAFPEYAQTAIQAHRGWLTETCSGEDTGVTQQCQTAVSACLNTNSDGPKDCSAQSAEMTCLSQTRTKCDVNETIVTFDALTDVLADVCTVVNPYVAPCFSLTQCLATTEYALIPGIDSLGGPPTVVYSQLLNTGFWCRYLQQTINCFLMKATVCAVPQTRVNAFDSTVDLLRASCAGDSGNAGGLNYNEANATVANVLNTLLWLGIALLFTCI